MCTKSGEYYRSNPTPQDSITFGQLAPGDRFRISCHSSSVWLKGGRCECEQCENETDFTKLPPLRIAVELTTGDTIFIRGSERVYAYKGYTKAEDIVAATRQWARSCDAHSKDYDDHFQSSRCGLNGKDVCTECEADLACLRCGERKYSKLIWLYDDLDNFIECQTCQYTFMPMSLVVPLKEIATNLPGGD